MKWTLHCDFADSNQKSCEFDFDTEEDNLPVPNIGETIDFCTWVLTVKQISHCYDWKAGEITFRELWIIADDLD